MSENPIRYRAFVDWDNDQGFSQLSFEGNLGGWAAHSVNSPIPSFGLSTEQSLVGEESAKVTWHTFAPFTFGDPDLGFGDGKFSEYAFHIQAFKFGDAAGGFGDGRFAETSVLYPTPVQGTVQATRTGIRPGDTYIAEMWVYVPSGSTPVRFRANGNVTAWTDVYDEWVQLALTFVAAGDSILVKIEPDLDNLVDGSTMYMDGFRFMWEHEEITTRIKDTNVSWQRGRDNSRSLSPISPGEWSAELVNYDGHFSPDRVDSPLHERIQPGLPILFTADYDGNLYELFQGSIDDFSIEPEMGGNSTASMASNDMLGAFNGVELSTRLYRGKRTGEVLHLILDYMGWPATKRDIDAGASVIPWWWEEGTSATDAILKVVQTEGLGAISTVDNRGYFIFRDRHHRIFLAESLDVQASFVPAGEGEPAHSSPFTYDLGWKDTYTLARFDVDERVPRPYGWEFGQYGIGIMETVWEDDNSVITLNYPGEERIIWATPGDPVYDAQIPSPSNPFPLEPDYTVIAGSVHLSLVETSGQKIGIKITCLVGPATVYGMRLRGISVPVARTIRVQAQEDDRMLHRSYDGELPWANANDAYAIAQTIVGNRRSRLPTVTITVNSSTHERVAQILNRELSDRVHIKEDNTGVDHDFYIERIEHDVSKAGKLHTTTFSCERVPQLNEGDNPPFQFGNPSAGFGDGVFATDGIDDPDLVFVLDESELGLGLLAY